MRNYEGEREGRDSDGILDREKKVGGGGDGIRIFLAELLSGKTFQLEKIQQPLNQHRYRGQRL